MNINPEAPAKEKQKAGPNQFFVAGFQFGLGKDLTEIDTVHPVREHGNRFDVNAVAIYTGSLKIGYVPAVLSGKLSKMEHLTLKVVKFDLTRSTIHRLLVEYSDGEQTTKVS